jgi:hypothetical protein
MSLMLILGYICGAIMVLLVPVNVFVMWYCIHQTKPAEPDKKGKIGKFTEKEIVRRIRQGELFVKLFN